MSFFAVILAGGKSSRMGQDKAQMLRPDGLTQLEYTQQQISTLAPEAIMISGSTALPDLYRGVDSGVDSGLNSGLGPLAGIHTAVETLSVGDTLLVVPCDLPLLTSKALTPLLSKTHNTAYRDSFLPCYLHITVALKQHLNNLLSCAEASESKNSDLSIKSLLKFCNVNWQKNPDKNSTKNTNTKDDWDATFSKN